MLEIGVGALRERIPPEARLAIGQQDEQADERARRVVAQQRSLVFVEDDDAATGQQVVFFEGRRPAGVARVVDPRIGRFDRLVGESEQGHLSEERVLQFELARLRSVSVDGQDRSWSEARQVRAERLIDAPDKLRIREAQRHTCIRRDETGLAPMEVGKAHALLDLGAIERHVEERTQAFGIGGFMRCIDDAVFGEAGLKLFDRGKCSSPDHRTSDGGPRIEDDGRPSRAVRIALKVAYEGDRFAGSQIQPDVRTVHGEVERALAALGGAHRVLSWAGRTDAGVSAATNVVAFDDPPLSPEALLPALTFGMDDVWTWAWAEVPAGFEPRHARRRWYRYHLRTALDPKMLDEALQVFVGTHDFSGFARVEPGVNPTRTVLQASARREGAFVLVDIEGESFLWNQVRRIVEASRRVAAEEISVDTLRATLIAGKPAELGTAPPEPLVLMDVEYPNVEWTKGTGRIFERLDRRLQEAELSVAIRRSLRG